MFKKKKTYVKISDDFNEPLVRSKLIKEEKRLLKYLEHPLSIILF